MKKKLLIALACAAVMSAGMAVTAQAGTWSESNGRWYYYNDSGSMVYGQWVLDNGAYYYIDYDGAMVVNQLIDDTYYVNERGVMITNSWRQIQDDPWTAESHWFYFGSNGQAYEDGWKTIDGVRYHFSGRYMDTGWLEDEGNVYYLTPSGAMATGWQYIYSDRADDWSDQNWYYFSATGRMSRSREQSIGGADYVFDEYGRMLTGWVDRERFTSSYYDRVSDDVNQLVYCESSGAEANGWRYLLTPDESDESWYYFRNGRAYTPDYRTTALNDRYGVARIDNEIYCFRDDGRMVTGWLELSDGRLYYFDGSGRMITGRTDINGESYYFNKSGSLGNIGMGYTGEHDDYLYDRGRLVRAEDGLRYEVVTVDGKQYMVNESGKVRTGGTVTDADGNKYEIDRSDNGGYTIHRVN